MQSYRNFARHTNKAPASSGREIKRALQFVSYDVVSCLLLNCRRESVAGDEDYDTVPVVYVVRLLGAAFGIDAQTVGADAVGLGESVVNGLCAALGELLVIGSCTGILVGVALDQDFHVGIGLEVFGCIVDIDHFLVGNLRGVDGKAYSRRERRLSSRVHRGGR